MSSSTSRRGRLQPQLRLSVEQEPTGFSRQWFSQYPRSVGGKSLVGYSMRTDRYRFTVWVDRKDHAKVDALELCGHSVEPQGDTSVANLPADEVLVKQLMEQWRRGWKGAMPRPTASDPPARP